MWGAVLLLLRLAQSILPSHTPLGSSFRPIFNDVRYLLYPKVLYSIHFPTHFQQNSISQTIVTRTYPLTAEAKRGYSLSLRVGDKSDIQIQGSNKPKLLKLRSELSDSRLRLTCRSYQPLYHLRTDIHHCLRDARHKHTCIHYLRLIY